MNKIAVIIAYFGKFNSLFPVWLKSCEWNMNIDFLIFTDDKREFDYPQNVMVHYMSFNDLKADIQKKYNFNISLNQPYRLCNFKPAYGDIFQDYLIGYDYWGFGDIDLVWGDFSNCLPANIDSYDRIGIYGHLMLIRNTEQLRTIYKYADAYKMAFSLDDSLYFDEDGFPAILDKLGFISYSLKIADLKPRIKSFAVLGDDKIDNWKNKHQAFIWDKGKLIRYYLHNDTIESEECLYIHFLKRPMVVKNSINLNEPILIVPNKITNIDLNTINHEFIVKQNNGGIFWAYWKNSFRLNTFFERLLNRIYRNQIRKNKIDRIRQTINS